MLRLLIILALDLAQASSSQPAASAPVQSRGSPVHRLVATADTADVPESSGVVASRVTPDVYWTHNDSGDGPFVWALRLAPEDRRRGIAPVLGRIELLGARNRDWEDIAWGPGHTIYMFDGGDNPPCRRDDKTIYRFVEPRVDASGPPFRIQLPCESMRFEYPDPVHPDQPARDNDLRYDAECLIVHPPSQDLYIVTKRDTRKVAVARVYRFPGARIRWNAPDAIHVLEFVGDITPSLRRLFDPFSIINAITAGDIDSTGTRLVLRDYLKAFDFRLPPGEPFYRIFQQAPVVTGLTGELQGEGICYTLDGREMLSTSEMIEFHRTRCPVFITPSANAGPPATTSPSGHP